MKTQNEANSKIVLTKFLPCSSNYHQECCYEQKAGNGILRCSCDCHSEGEKDSEGNKNNEIIR